MQEIEKENTYSLAERFESQLQEIASQIYLNIRQQSSVYLPNFPSASFLNRAVLAYRRLPPQHLDLRGNFSYFLNYKNEEKVIIWHGIQNHTNSHSPFNQTQRFGLTALGEMVEWHFVDNWKSNIGEYIVINKFEPEQILSFDWRNFLFNSSKEAQEFADKLKEELAAIK